MQRSEDLRVIHASEPATLETTSVVTTIAPDPLYTPLLDAIHHLRSQLDSQHQAELEALKRATANQTEALYHRLTEAREHFVALERNFEIKISELSEAQHTIQLLNNQLAAQAEALQNLEVDRQSHQQVMQELNQKYEQLIDKLKAKIEAFQADYQQQVDNLQSKLNYQKLHHEEQMNMLTNENLNLTQELHNTRREYLELHQSSQGSRDAISQLQQELASAHQLNKERAEKLLRAEHSLKIAQEEIERNQRYVRELEDKNNAIQKELFENWIVKKDEL